MKVATVVGARPQFVKVAAVRRAISSHNQSSPGFQIQDCLIHTGQHYDDNMSLIFFEELGIAPPDYHLNIGGLSHGAMTGRMLEHLENVLVDEKPDWVLVYGDTNTTLAGALAAAKLHIPVAHVEAGLRSFNRQMPEEINRIVADHCSDLLLTTHSRATEQLLLEGIPKTKIREVGDVMCDIAQFHHECCSENTTLLETMGLTKGQYVLVTIHRASNTDDPHRLREIMNGLALIADQMPVVFAVHPRTRHALDRLSDGVQSHAQLKLIDPLGYLEMLTLELGARVIVTDSGGVQKEAYFCHVPCLVLRDETEWTELVKHGYARLVQGEPNAILEAFKELLTQNLEWKTALYGSGDASQKIVQALVDKLG